MSLASKLSQVISRWRYYLASIPTILLDVDKRLIIIAAFLGLPIRWPFIVRLKNGCRFKVRTAMDIWIIKEACLDRDYERNAVSIRDHWTIIDIGAGLGDFAICTANEHKHAQVYVYEPFPESFALLQENIALNRISNIRAFRCAIGAHAGTMQLDTATGVAVKHSTATTATGNAAAFQVPSITLDQVFEELELQSCDFLKMDCEGGEYDILFHASDETLRKIKHICLEYHDGVTSFSHVDLVRFLEDRGFCVRTRANPAHAEIGFLHAANTR